MTIVYLVFCHGLSIYCKFKSIGSWQETNDGKESFSLLLAIWEKGTPHLKIQKRVAIALWRLSTRNSFRSTAAVFGVGKSRAVDLTKVILQLCGKVSRQFYEISQK